MTLIVGIKCEDGIVLGADGAATYGVMGQHTIRQSVKNKLQILKGRLVIGVSGPVGLGQRFSETLEHLWDEKKFSGCAPAEAMTVLSESFRKHIFSEFNAAKIARELIGQSAFGSALSHTLVAAPIMKRLCLFQLDQQGAPEMVTSDLPFVAIGSGQVIADPFLALLRRLCWPDRQPTLGEATFAVVWTLHHAIETNPGGVAAPMQVVWLRGENAKELADDDLQEHKQRVAEVEDTLSKHIETGGAAEADAEPVPPSEPAK